MELGQRIRQARLEAGLSQRQLCGERITRNMLSQIENGSARPSMETMRYLAQRLGKPMGFFLEEQAVTSPNQAVMEQARQTEPQQVLEILRDFREPDEVFSRERWLLEVLACMQAARQAIEEEKTGLALTLLERCATAGEKTPYYTPELERERILLIYEADPRKAADLLSLLYPDDRELLLRARAAQEMGQMEQATALLRSARGRSDEWYWLSGRLAEATGDFAGAVGYLEQIQKPTIQIYAALERCCKALEDYKKAYEYACKQR